MLVFVFERLHGFKVNPFHTRTLFVLRYLRLREQWGDNNMGGGHQKPLMLMGMFSSHSWMYLVLHSKLQPWWPLASFFKASQSSDRQSVRGRRRSVYYCPSSPRSATQKSLTLFRSSGERGSHETNMMTSWFKNERAGTDGACMCSRREPCLSYALRRATTWPTARFVTKYCCCSVCWNLDFNTGNKDRNCEIHPDKKRSEIRLTASSGKIALTQAFWGVPESQRLTSFVIFFLW